MKNPNPLSNDWLYWDPETIHTYPDAGDPGELSRLTVVPERIPHARLPSRSQTRVLMRELLRDLAAGVVSGLVAAILLALLIAFFPGTTRAQTHESPPRSDVSQRLLALLGRNVEKATIPLAHLLTQKDITELRAKGLFH